MHKYIAMKTLLLISLALLLSCFASAQQFVGDWQGSLHVMGTELPLIFHIESSEDGDLSATMDSPSQAGFGIPVDEITVNDKQLNLSIKSIGFQFAGALHEDGTIAGHITQFGQKMPLTLSLVDQQDDTSPTQNSRPQDPIAPFPYFIEDLVIESVGDVKLGATLTLPDSIGPHPVVVLVSGSGPQNRDQEILNHRPFHVIADHFARRGIGTLRYDDRGTAESTGDFKSATSFDFAQDATAAMTYLLTRSEVKQDAIGMIGHSEGGLIAAMVAAENSNLDFIILLAGPGEPGKKVLLDQSRLLAEAEQAPIEAIDFNVKLLEQCIELILSVEDPSQRKADLNQLLESELKDAPESVRAEIPELQPFIAQQVDALSSDWFRYFLLLDPAIALSKVQCPVLALNGELDLQVPAEANLKAIESALNKAGNKNVKTLALPGLNHLFQNAKTGGFEEYQQIEETFAPSVLEIMTEWINEHQ